ncbi:MAG: ATP-binding cassette domain-containing protein [Methanobrevibacter ruminantium]|uniref:ABC transporter ATP-binding protein n=1 Tax=Methanobrevibacter ruminantium TaxID=83816 RepID=UPI0026E95DCC|nr:ATP-binding cassette domain-containing protein [Methanobrevibacter ruminantium]MCI5737240.1 ATP-binding cassette domain-containing protein [Methanobrevibacter ruminantium]MDD6049604.1 ATP-binding cassette domain-containing protein [Methanobrevibacter ruminantium]MDO5842650.1 ATP-binding cassette domain-containing protein [Methanobrevibacter ruminantium]
MELTGRNISFKYSSGSRQILKDVDITIDNKKILGLFGDSGSGKSSLCKILAGHIKRYDGEVRLDGNEIPKSGFNPVQLIYQHPEKVMNPKWKMHEVLEESWDVPDGLLEDFGIQKSWLNRWPAELSGGELQRFSVLRSLNPKTKFLIADEMTTMLDAITQVQIFESVLKIVKERNMGLLVVSHDRDLMDIICDEVIYLDDINHI